MKNREYKVKRFLPQILSLTLLSIILIASISTYITISTFKNHMNEHITLAKKEYIEEQKAEVYKAVHFLDDSIKFQIAQIENRLKASLKERVQIAIDVTNIIYKQYKETLTKEEIKTKISEALATIRFNDNRGYYFMYDNKTKVLFGHPMKKFIGKDMTNFRDVRDRSLMQTDAKILEKEKIGFNRIYFNKPNNQNKEFPKITCITKFEALDIVIGTGEYLDVIEKQTKQYVLERFAKIKYSNKNRYLFIFDIHDINGGEEFATMLLNSNKPELIGKKISSKIKDIKGKRFREEYLQNIKEKGESFTQYWFKKPSTKLPELKMSYTFLQKDWNWLIGSGFYYTDLQKEIQSMENSIAIYTRDTIKKALIWVVVLSLIVVLITGVISLKIDKTIKEYMDQIIDYEKNKREQDSLLIQQSKMASMGEMMESIAHQWRQPLSIISSSSSGIKMQKEFGTLSDEQLIELCDGITKSTTHLSNTINDFRDFFKKDKEKHNFNIKNTFNKTIKLLHSIIKNSDIEIIQNIDKVTVSGFENELVQVFMNILNNAKDELELHEHKRLIFVDIHKVNENVCISIKDNAGGIPTPILSKIFDSHFTTKEERNGTGIGLHMSKKIIEDSFNGTINVKNCTFSYENIKYYGAEFLIILPIRTENL